VWNVRARKKTFGLFRAQILHFLVAVEVKFENFTQDSR
jgi:hypothetical protein